MLAGLRQIGTSAHWRHVTARNLATAESLGQAVRAADTLVTLNLQASPDLLCVNLMCEKVGAPCICRLSRVLEQLHYLEGLNLANNKLISLPESIGQLEQLRHLDLSNNNLQRLPASMQQLKQLQVTCEILPLSVALIFSLVVLLCCLQVLNLRGNCELQDIAAIMHTTSLQKLYLDQDLLDKLPAHLKQLAHS